MSKEQILKKALEKAVENGFHSEELIAYFPRSTAEQGNEFMQKALAESPQSIIFRHDFVKAFVRYLLTDEHLEKPKSVVRVKKLGYDAGLKRDNVLEIMKSNFLQEMVLQKEPLEYIEKYL